MTRRTRGKALARNKGGRPPIVLGPKELHQLETLAGYGLTEAAIAAVLGIGSRTLREKKHAEEVSAALERGRAKAEAAVGKALYVRAVEGEGWAVRWWEMTRAGRTEKGRLEMTGAEGGPLHPSAITVRLVRPMEQWTDDQLERVARGEDPRRVLGPPE